MLSISFYRCCEDNTRTRP